MLYEQPGNWRTSSVQRNLAPQRVWRGFVDHLELRMHHTGKEKSIYSQNYICTVQWCLNSGQITGEIISIMPAHWHDDTHVSLYAGMTGDN